MEYTYEIDLNDMMNYQEELLLSNMSPSIRDSIKRWEKVVFAMLLVVIPLLLLLFFRDLKLCVIAIIIDIILFVLFKRSSALLFWKSYKAKGEKDLVATYFKNKTSSTITYRLKMSPDKLEIESEFAKKTIKLDDIIYKKSTDRYIFFYTSKHDASLIPLNKPNVDNAQIREWFSSINV